MRASTSYVCPSCRFALRLKPRVALRKFSISRVLNSSSFRPPTAPKPAPNVKHICENTNLYSKNCIDRNYKFAADYPFQIQSLAKEASELQYALRQPRSRIKHVEKDIAKLASRAARQKQHNENSATDMKEIEALGALRSEAKQLKDTSQRMLERREVCMQEIQRLALSLPNLTSSETPIGAEPIVVGYINFDPNSPLSYPTSSYSPQARSHVSIGTELGLVDFTSSATSTGWGWYFLTNEGCLLEHALVQYALSIACKRGWKPVSPPSIVYSYIAEACGFQPRDAHNEQQIWSIQQSEKDIAANKPQRSLTGTAEIPFAAMHAGQELDARALPIKVVGASRCYRAEAGARGVDTKGLYRVHEFTKVELFAWVDSYAESFSSSNGPGKADIERPSSTSLFAEMLSIQSEILESLNLPCRILEMPSADLGASAIRKRDIEVLFPSRIKKNHTSVSPDGNQEVVSDQTSAVSNATTESTAVSSSPQSKFDFNGWGEVTSTSICTDYQTRRLGTRVRGGTAYTASRHPYTVNGTAIAVPRVLAAILEHGWDEKVRGVIVPEVLRPWMGGLEIIQRKGN